METDGLEPSHRFESICKFSKLVPSLTWVCLQIYVSKFMSMWKQKDSNLQVILLTTCFQDMPTANYHILPGHRFICLTYLEPDMTETNAHVRNIVGMTRFELAPALRMLCIPNAARLTNSSTSRFILC